MGDVRTSLAALVGSRLCHDLISPIGAIQNGLELMSLAGSGDTSEEMKLIQDSCDSAAARVRFFRVAFGSANDGQGLGHREIVATLEGIYRGSRLRVIWTPSGDMPRADAQLGYLGILCCESALPRGGEVTVRREGQRLMLSGTGPRIAPRPDSWSLLQGQPAEDDITPDRVQFALLDHLARDRGLALDARVEEAAIRLTIR